MVRHRHHIELPTSVHRLSEAFGSAGFELYVVGGAVRDAVLGALQKDFDLATNAHPEQVMKIVSNMPELIGTDEVGKSFGVIRARFRDSLLGHLHLVNEYEIATFRTDIGAGRRPDAVEFTTIENDVLRRDLTINALFYDIRTSEIVDLVGGLADIATKTIRTVGAPEDRFSEDRLRVLRAIRFSTRLGYDISSEIAESIARDCTLAGVSPERVRDELVKAIRSSSTPYRLCIMLTRFNMWNEVLPGLKISAALPNTQDVSVFLAALLQGNDPEHVASTLNRLKYSVDEVRQITFLLRFTSISSESAFRMRKAFQISRLEFGRLVEHMCYVDAPNVAMANAFKAYLGAPPVKGDVVMAEGYSGQALGREIERRETELFKRLVEEEDA